MNIFKDGVQRKATPDEEASILAQQALDSGTHPVVFAEVKAEAARRIELAMPMWMIARELSGGGLIPQEAKDAAAFIRQRSNEIEQLDPIPVNFREDSFWE